MDELLSRALDARGGLGNCAGMSGLTAEMSLAFAEVSGPDDLSRRLQVRADAERTGKLLAHGTTTCLPAARLEGQ